MNQEPFDKDPLLQAKLQEDLVEVPDFPMKASRWNRLLHYLGSPAQDPFEPIVATKSGVISLKVLPVAGGAALVAAQFLFFL
ncbi:hypothetical protein [Planococcus ruber]|uniref:hypothetical protein n=1 Tax=Planococcus ruber TaxID=2027871 RepID=UPI001FEFC85A|nr:hypothetical protein [Planococcus ruber]MCJ1910110.1 hypothetical protein [Planococcus ruber]